MENYRDFLDRSNEALKPLVEDPYKVSVVDTILRALSQTYIEQVEVDLSAKVLPAGRFVARAPRGARVVKPKLDKPAVVLEVDGDFYFRPNGAKYFARQWGEHQDVATLRRAREATAIAFSDGAMSAMFSLLYGAPGCGKTALVEAAFGENVYTLLGTGDTEVADLLGGYVQLPSGKFEWVDGDFVKAAENGGVYFIDEIGLIDPKVLSIVYGAMDGRREFTIPQNPSRGTIVIHPDFYVVAATNPNAPGVRLSEALLSRFTLQVEMTTDWSLAKKLGVPQYLITAATNLSKKCEAGETSWAPQMRELLAFRDIESTFGQQFAVSNLIAAAPEIDRPVVADILTRVVGAEVKAARI